MSTIITEYPNAALVRRGYEAFHKAGIDAHRDSVAVKFFREDYGPFLTSSRRQA